MRKATLFIFVVLLLYQIFPKSSFSVAPYDSFSKPTIDKKKWQNWEEIREIQDGKLVSKTTAYGSNIFNNLNFKNPASINYYEADVTIDEITGTYDKADQSKFSIPGAELGGRFYNDGTGSPGSLMGEVQAFVRIYSLRGQYHAGWYVQKSLDGINFTNLDVAWFPISITVGQTYKLSILWEPALKKFTFSVNEFSQSWVSTDTVIYSAVSPWRALQTYVWLTASNLRGKVSASFDNVIAKDESGNIVMTDDFSSPTLDGTKWASGELVREISDGKLRSMQSGGSEISLNYLYFINPSSIQTVQVKVSPQTYQIPQEGFALSGIGGQFYNDGTPDSSVGAGIYVGGIDGSNPVGTWRVSKITDWTNPAGATIEEIASGDFSTPILLGNTYTLFLGWDGNQFTFIIDDEEANYVPTTTINPSPIASRQIGTIIDNPPGGEAAIEALFDDVYVNVTAPPVLDSIIPDPFSLGVNLTLSGERFGKKGTVKIGAKKAKIVEWSDTSIICSISSGLAGTYPVKVIVEKKESNILNCTLSGPVIDMISLQEGPLNTLVTISGRYFGIKKPTVQFISSDNKIKTAKVTAYLYTEISFLVPKVKTGQYQIKIKNSAGISNAVVFEVE